MTPPLTPGHIHQWEDWNRSLVVNVYPTPGGLWHIGISGSPFATEEPVAEARVYEILAERGIVVEGWRSWRGLAATSNPAWAMGIGRALRGERIG